MRSVVVAQYAEYAEQQGLTFSAGSNVGLQTMVCHLFFELDHIDALAGPFRPA